MGRNVEGSYWASILHTYCTTISFPGFGRLVLGLFSVYSDYGYIHFILSFETVVVFFLSSEVELFMAVVSDVNSVTFVIDIY